MEKILSENAIQKVVENPDGSVRIFSKIKKSNSPPDKSWRVVISKKRWQKDWFVLDPTQRSTLVSLWLYADKSGVCWASMRTLSAELDISLATIQKTIKILKEKKFLEVATRRGQKGKNNRYTLLK